MKNFSLNRRLLRSIHRLIIRTVNHYEPGDVTLTLSLPPFVKLEIKAKAKSSDDTHLS